MATNQKSVLRATREAIRPREPASRASDRQGSMGRVLGFCVPDDEKVTDPGCRLGERRSCAPKLRGPLSSRRSQPAAGPARGLVQPEGPGCFSQFPSADSSWVAHDQACPPLQGWVPASLCGGRALGVSQHRWLSWWLRTVSLWQVLYLPPLEPLTPEIASWKEVRKTDLGAQRRWEVAQSGSGVS